MDKKPDLSVKLFAGEVLVDQSTDVALWQRVLLEIRGVTPNDKPGGSPENGDSSESKRGNSSLARFAKFVGVTADELRGGLDPSDEAPFISLDGRSWEALKRNTPTRGPGGVPPAVLAATALTAWQKHQPIGDVTLSIVRNAMNTIDLDDPNAARALNNCDWLQIKGGRVVLNPARLSSAARLLRAFCKRETISETD